jgi:uncharacterized protein (DUF58 family)
MRARTLLEGTLSGIHRSPFHGFAAEFSQFKSYAPGDDLRFLDWKAFARKEQPVLRQYRDETNTAVHLILDTSASMGPASGAPGKWETTQVLAASLALLAERQRDSVSLTSGRENSLTSLPARGGSAIRELVRRIDSLECAGKTDLEALCADAAERVRGQSFGFVFSDGWMPLDPLERGLRQLRVRTRTLILVLMRSAIENQFPERGQWRLQDIETGEEREVSAAAAGEAYRQARHEHDRDLARRLGRMGIPCLVLGAEDAPGVSLRRLLALL